MSEMCGGTLHDTYLHSSELYFIPGTLRSQKTFVADTETAGYDERLWPKTDIDRSTMLLVQVSFPCMIFGPCEMEITYHGGTNAILAPPVDYLNMVGETYPF